MTRTPRTLLSTPPQEEAAYHAGLKVGDEAEAMADSGEESIPSEEEKNVIGSPLYMLDMPYNGRIPLPKGSPVP